MEDRHHLQPEHYSAEVYFDFGSFCRKYGKLKERKVRSFERCF